MNAHKASALLHYLAAVKKRIGANDLQMAARFRRHGQIRTDKPSGAQRRYQVRYGGKYRFDAKAKVWRIQAEQGVLREIWKRLTRSQQRRLRVPRGRLSNPTVLR